MATTGAAQALACPLSGSIVIFGGHIGLSRWHLICISVCYSPVLLVRCMLQKETYILAVGQVAGQYYLIIVDQQHSLFIRTTLISAALYACNTIVKSTSLWLSELLAYRSGFDMTSSFPSECTIQASALDHQLMDAVGEVY